MSVERIGRHAGRQAIYTDKARKTRMYVGRLVVQDGAVRGVDVSTGKYGFDTYEQALAHLDNVEPSNVSDVYVMVEIVHERRARTTFIEVLPGDDVSINKGEEQSNAN